jgi:hypothetical protein
MAFPVQPHIIGTVGQQPAGNCGDSIRMPAVDECPGSRSKWHYLNDERRNPVAWYAEIRPREVCESEGQLAVATRYLGDLLTDLLSFNALGVIMDGDGNVVRGLLPRFPPNRKRRNSQE